MTSEFTTIAAFRDVCSFLLISNTNSGFSFIKLYTFSNSNFEMASKNVMIVLFSSNPS
jgi:hypothetical protein